MKINLSKEITDHFLRLQTLADEAERDEEESFSSRASAMSALTGMLKELTKTQAEIVNMQHLMLTEQALIEAAKEIFPSEDYHIFTEKLTELLNE
jgi:hypothetical protein